MLRVYAEMDALLPPPWIELAALEVSDDLFSSDHEGISDTQSPRLSKVLLVA